jgi:hypothetical protein
MCDSSIVSVQFAALIDTLRIFSFSIEVMIKIKYEKQILRFSQDGKQTEQILRAAQDDKHFRHSRAGGNERHFFSMALVSRRRIDGNLRCLVRFDF